jgi:hypothetical protein
MLAATCQAGPEVAATRSLTVQPAGVRKGEAGAEYCNIEGKGNGKYASFGVLTFPAPEAGASDGRVEDLTLTLVQSIPSFAKDGKVRFFLLDEGRVEPEGLKFDEASPDGVGKRFEGRLPLGTGEFKKVETGHVNTFALTLDDAARKLVGRRLGGGGEIHILIVPNDHAVAATYFGAGEEEAGRRPRLTLKLVSP